MKNTLALIAILVIFGGAIVFIIVNAIRRREINFEGTVIDKNIIENRANNNSMMNRPGGGIMIGGNMNGGVTHEYKIRVKTDLGKEINYKITEGMYEIIKIGDRVSKASGTTEITIQSSPSQVPPPGPTNNSPTSSVPPTTPIPPSMPNQNNNPQSFV
jgi:hypothetical protein